MCIVHVDVYVDTGSRNQIVLMANRVNVYYDSRQDPGDGCSWVHDEHVEETIEATLIATLRCFLLVHLRLHLLGSRVRKEAPNQMPKQPHKKTKNVQTSTCKYM